MRGVYQIPVVNVTVASAAVTLAFLNQNTAATVLIKRAWCSQNGVTSSAQQRVQLNTQVTSFPTLTTITPTKSSTLDQASQIVGGTTGAAGTCGINASAEGAGAKTVLVPDTFNVLTGWLWTPTPDEVIAMASTTAAGFGLHFPVAAGTTSGWSGGITYQEIG
jgi:hypothetical protein